MNRPAKYSTLVATMYHQKLAAQMLAYQNQGIQQTAAATALTGPIGWGTYSSASSTQPAQRVAQTGRDLSSVYDIKIVDGEACVISFPDGTVINVAADGSFTIDDKDAKVIYRANRLRDFNPFINASDKIEAFITFCKIVGVRQNEFMDLPIKHFIAWLIIEAARADGEPKPEVTLVSDLREITQPRCRCGRFLPRKLAARRIAFCRPMCLERELAA